MNEETSLISIHPFFRKFVFSIVQTIRERDFERKDRTVIDADLVPRVSERVMMASMGRGVVVPAVEEVKPKTGFVRRDMSELVAPIKSRAPEINQINNMRAGMDIRDAAPARPVVAPRQVVMPSPIAAPPVQEHRAPMPPIRVAPAPIQERAIMPMPSAPVVAGTGTFEDMEKYGKLSPLLNDPSVSTIECVGKDKEIMIIRAGQKQRTRIVLSADEIKEILNQVADAAHIPLLEGVFRAAVVGFSINAVISEMVGSRFVIKKATAYGLLE